MREEALLFGQNCSLVGVITWPRNDASDPTLPAVLLLNAGILHRIGPNRTYVKIARTLAALGFVVLRFDFSGIGDSLPRTDALPFERSFRAEVQQAMGELQSRCGSTQFILMGLCSGAMASLHMAAQDRRVVGAVLINPRSYLHDMHNEELEAALRQRTLRAHYRRILFCSSLRWKNWRKALTGSFNLPLLRQALRGFRLPRPSQRQEGVATARGYALSLLNTLSARGVRLLHVFAEGDEGLDYLHVVLGKEAHALPLALIRGANHTFTTLWSQERLVQVICDWAKEFTP